MIPAAAVTAWGDVAPWPDEAQIEQDLYVSRLIIEIANNELLKDELAFRGGTCLHKLHLPEPLRYSEDLDYTRTNDEKRIGDIFTALREIAGLVGLTESRRKLMSKDSDTATIWFDDKERGDREGRIRIKIETNVAETQPLDDHVFLPHAVESAWWSGSAGVRTFRIEEILATKIRALCQRRKGRDLFDLWIGLNRPGLDDTVVVQALNHYMSSAVYSYPQLVLHLNTKVGDPEFEADIDTLVTSMPKDYDQATAIELIRRRIGLKLRNVPPDVAAAAAAQSN